MNRKEIERFVKLLDGKDTGSLSIEIEGSVLKITRDTGRIRQSSAVLPHAGFGPIAGSDFSFVGAGSIEADAPVDCGGQSSRGADSSYRGADPSDLSALHLISSRYVGFFYSTSVSDAVQTLSIGDRVRKGQPVGMVESMGIEHIIKSDVEGVLRSLEASDGQPVEYGQPLLRLEIVHCEETAR